MTLTDDDRKVVDTDAEMMFCEAASVFVKGLASSFLFALTLGATGDFSISAFVGVAYLTALVSLATLQLETLKVPQFLRKGRE